MAKKQKARAGGPFLRSFSLLNQVWQVRIINLQILKIYFARIFNRLARFPQSCHLTGFHWFAELARERENRGYGLGLGGLEGTGSRIVRFEAKLRRMWSQKDVVKTYCECSKKIDQVRFEAQGRNEVSLHYVPALPILCACSIQSATSRSI